MESELLGTVVFSGMSPCSGRLAVGSRSRNKNTSEFQIAVNSRSLCGRLLPHIHILLTSF